MTCACGRPCAALVAVLDRLSRLEAGAVTRRLSRADRARLERLLPAIGGAFASAPFLVKELRASDAPGLRLVLGALNAKQLGRLLRRAVNVPIADCTVECCGEENHAILWRVLTVVAEEGARSSG